MLVIATTSNQLSAQGSMFNPVNWFKGMKFDKAEELYEKMAYGQAAEQYEDLIWAGDTTLLTYKRLAECYRKTNRWKKAEPILEYIVQKEPRNAKYIYNYTMALQSARKYDKAYDWMKKYLELEPEDSRALEFVQKFEYVEKVKEGQSSALFVSWFYNFTSCDAYNMKAINSPYSDFGAIAINKSDILFASSRGDELVMQNKDGWNQEPFLDFYIVDVNNDTISEVARYPGEINSVYHDGPACLSRDGKTMYLTRNNPESESDKGRNCLMILQAKLVGFEWTGFTKLPINNNYYSVGHPALSPDESRLYFTSDMPGGIGGSDIYYVDIGPDGRYGKPVNLGKPINTEGNEMFPFVSSKGILFFTSDGHVGLGGLDIFYSFPDDNDEYTRFENIGLPINSAYDDFSLFMRDDEKTGFFASNRPGGRGGDDVFGFRFLNPLEKTIRININTVDQVTSKNASRILISVYDKETGKVVTTARSNEKGMAIVELEMYKTYRIEARGGNYLPENEELPLMTRGNIDLTMRMNKVPDLFINGWITQTDTLLPIGGAVVRIRDNMKGEQVYNQKAVTGIFNYKMDKKLGDDIDYTINVEKEGYIGREYHIERQLKTPDTIYVHELYDLKLSKIEPGKDLGKAARLKPFYFDYESAEVRSDAKEQIDIIIGLMKQYPNMVIELRMHTDSRGNDNFNLGLSQRRANQVAAYMISQGISAENIIPKGYGESQLLNDCEDGVPCSRAEHQINNRTEFIIRRVY